MASKILTALIALVVLGAVGLAVQPSLAQPQGPVMVQDLRLEIRRLEARVARLEREAKPRFQPAS
jgi:hypothetical protein